ncbi:MAG TPA: winged helix-turn-helix domain-containing protein [Vicinamibacterales bacterium]|nr:winged helix-turn-helix domain-containing protein [Vicinamibacterales bacterium]
MASPEVYEFGDFVLDVSERRLSSGDRALALAPKAYDLLVALVRRAGGLITKRELLELVWPDAHVEEGILAVHVSSLRKALGDRGGGWIETVSRAGYRFRGPVTRRAARTEPFPLRWPIGVLPAEPAVSELIGRGRAHLLTASMAEIPKAVAAFKSAIALDPTYAAAHAGLARACCAQAELRVVPHAEAYGEARTAALRALAMDDACADAKVALGTVMFFSDWNWTGAQRSLERALELDPDHTEAQLLYGRLLEALGELERGLAAKQKALERHPFSALVHLQIALSFWNQRRYDDVIAWASRALDLDPRHLLAREYISSAYWKKGDFDRHMAEALTHAESYGVPAGVLDELKQVYARGGRRGLVEHTIAAQSANPNHVQMAILHGELGNLDDAFRHLDLAIERRDPSLVHLAVAPQWDSLRGDPRFAERLAGMELVAAAPRSAVT